MHTNISVPLVRLACYGLLAMMAQVPGWVCAADAGDAQFDKLYAVELRKVQSTAADTGDDLALAQQLVAIARQTADNPAYRLSLLRHAVPLALQDAAGGPVVQAIAEGLVADNQIAPVAVWQMLADAASPVLQRRNQVGTDPLIDPYLDWLKNLAQAQDAAGDSSSAERTLSRLERDAGAQRRKYRADDAAQLRTRLHYLAPFKRNAERELAKIKPGANDSAANRTAAENALGMAGDLDGCSEALRGLNDPRWDLILAMHAQRADPAHAITAAPAGAVDLLTAADYLAALGKSAKPASLPGRAFFWSESAALLARAQTADQSGLSTQQKLDLAVRVRAAQETSRAAQADLAKALESAAPVPWVWLVSPAVDNDWIRVVNTSTWTVQPGNELESGRTWGSVLRHRRAHPADFILEGELQRGDAQSHPLILLREHNLTSGYSLELSETQGHVVFTKPLADDADLATFPVNLPVKQWVPFRIVCDGGHMLIWIDGEIKADVRDEGDLNAGGLCVGAALGSAHFRNLRLREL